MANTIPGLNVSLAQYEQVWGKKIRMLVDHFGPASYSNVAVSGGTGDLVYAKDFNRGGIEEAGITFGGFSNSGLFYVRVTLPGANTLALGSAQQSVSLQWFAVSPAFGTIGAEVTNASTALVAESVRLVLTMV